MPCEPGKHAVCLPGSQGIFLHLHGRLEDLFSIPQAVRYLLPEGSEGKGKSDRCKRRVPERMSQVARTGSTRFVPVSSAWMLLIGACASLSGFMARLVPSLSFLGIPSVRKTAPVYLPLGRKKNSENAAALSASLDGFFSFFISNAHPYVVGPRLLHRLP
jgi:hypothetical protein